MTFHVFVTTPRAGFSRAVAPYTVETKEIFATRAEAQAFADAKTLSPGVLALLNAMPSPWPAWQVGSRAAPVLYPTDTFRSHAGATWRCLNGHSAAGDPNFAPGVTPSLWIKVQPPGLSAWDFPVFYQAPAQCTDDGRLYQLKPEAHSSLAGWRPSIVPSVWQDIGSASAVQPYTRATWNVVSSEDPDYTQVERAREA